MWLSAIAPNRQAHCSLTSLLSALLLLLLLSDHGMSPVDCLHVVLTGHVLVSGWEEGGEGGRERRGAGGGMKVIQVVMKVNSMSTLGRLHDCHAVGRVLRMAHQQSALIVMHASVQA